MNPVLRYAVLTGVVLAVLLAGRGAASADNGPHVQGAGATTDSCAGCHRVHVAQAANLLTAAQPGLCYSCHGTGGPGADTAVQEGKLYGGGGAFTALKAGGFDFALIDTADLSGGGPSVIGTLTAPGATTSWHTNDGASGTVWGNGAVGSGAGGSYSLACGSCHDPHGNGQYRILRPSPLGSGGSGQSVTDEADPKDYDTTNYINVWYVAGGEISGWCAQCHTRYLADINSSHTSSGDGIFNYRHVSDGTAITCDSCHAEFGPTTFVDHELSCIKCHAAHGTNAVTIDGGHSEAVPWPDGSAASGENTRLLKMDNRGICQKCHNK